MAADTLAGPQANRQAADAASEDKVLRLFVGEWDSKDYNRKALWNPLEEKTTTRSRHELILNGTVLQIRGTVDQNKTEFLQLIAYDRGKQSYRHYYFNSLGQLSETVGQWDAARRRFTFMGEAPDGVTVINTVQLNGPDEFEWKVLARDREGKVYLDMGGVAKRARQ